MSDPTPTTAGVIDDLRGLLSELRRFAKTGHDRRANVRLNGYHARVIEQSVKAIESLLSDRARMAEMEECAFKEAYQLGFLEGYQCEPRCDLSDPEERATALLCCDGTSEAWSDYAATRGEEGCKWCNDGCGWYTSYSGGFARWVPCNYCNYDGTAKPDPRAAINKALGK